MIVRKQRAAVITAGLVLLASTSGVARPGRRHSRGEALFFGGAPLTGKIRGHATPLPPAVVKCINCHGADSRGDIKRVAPQVNRALLLERRSRRGGPPSAYDQASFCTLLRTGVDPASVTVAREMPTYTIDDGGCRDLWLFLTKD